MDELLPLVLQLTNAESVSYFSGVIASGKRIVKFKSSVRIYQCPRSCSLGRVLCLFYVLETLPNRTHRPMLIETPSMFVDGCVGTISHPYRDLIFSACSSL